MFDIAPTELLLIVVVAVLVIGPKDMPIALRAVGRWIGHIRRISGHFRSGLDAMIREAEMQEMEKKWREQNEKIMRENPAGSFTEQEPTGAYPGRTTPTKAPVLDVTPAPAAVPSASAEAAVAAPVEAAQPVAAVAVTGVSAEAAVAPAADTAGAADTAVPAAPTAPVLGPATGSQPAAEPVSAEARASAIAAATGGAFDGIKG